MLSEEEGKDMQSEFWKSRKENETDKGRMRSVPKLYSQRTMKGRKQTTDDFEQIILYLNQIPDKTN